MQEIFENIDEETKKLAETYWNMIFSYDPLQAAKFLDHVIREYEAADAQEIADFLRFYFNMKLEMMKE